MKRDLTNQRFGRLVALEPTDKRAGQLVVWRCRCDCGNECEVPSSLLVKGNTRSCGCLGRGPRLDLSGQRFGRLAVMRPTDRRSRGSVVWECRCDCGNTCEVATGLLRSGQVRSCGCLRREASVKNLSGQRFGRLTAIRPIGRKSRYVLWECRCDCGNTCEVTTGKLNAGKVKSCGCLAAERRKAPEQTADVRDRERKPRQRPASAKNLAGKRFGRLTVIKRIGTKHNYALWECACDCGNVATATTNQLTMGNVRSCGCLRRAPRGENLAGQRFGDLVAAEPTERRERGSVVWRCLCDCGRECEMSAIRLKRLNHPTCGKHA